MTPTGSPEVRRTVRKDVTAKTERDRSLPGCGPAHQAPPSPALALLVQLPRTDTRRPLISGNGRAAGVQSESPPAHGGHHALLRRQLPVERLFMTFLETSAVNGQYLEAEVLLFGNGA